MTPRPIYSLVVPIYNEEAVLPHFFPRLDRVLDELDGPAEVVMVDDGSRDGSVALIEAKIASDPRYRLATLSRNFGQQIAITAGLEFASGRAVIIMDADLQDPPEVVFALVERWKAGFDVVCAKRAARPGDSSLKIIPAKIFYGLMSRLAQVDIPANVGDFRLVDRKVVDVVRRMPERDRFVRGLFSWAGFRHSYVTFDRPARAAGDTKYSFRKLAGVAANALVGFSDVPLRLALWAGIAVSLMALMFGAFVIVHWFVASERLPGVEFDRLHYGRPVRIQHADDRHHGSLCRPHLFRGEGPPALCHRPDGGDRARDARNSPAGRTGPDRGARGRRPRGPRPQGVLTMMGLPSPTAAFRWPVLASLGCVLVSIVLRMVSHTNGDVSWLLETAERTLGGATPYRDFLEPNPPASILLYVPAIVLAHLSGIRPEAMTDALVFGGMVVSLALCGSILLDATLIDRPRALALCPVACFVLLVLPLHSFGQREQIVLLAILPAIASLAARLAGRTPAAWTLILAGVGAGVALSVKPIFGLALLAPLVQLFRDRSWRAVLAAWEMWIAVALAALYALSVAVFYPDYAARIVPLLVSIYIPARIPLLELVTSPPVWIFIPLAYTYCRTRSADESIGLALILASLGFEACFFIQGKGFYYHGFPAVALATLACAGSVFDFVRAGANGRLVTRYAAAMAAVAGSLFVFAEHYNLDDQAPGLLPAMTALAPKPRLISIGGDMIFGRVLARELGGQWVSSTPLAWITCYAVAITRGAEHDPRFAGPIDMERDLYAADIARNRPDLILVEGAPWLRWANRSPALVRALADYRDAGVYGEVRLFSRKPMSGIGAGALSDSVASASIVGRRTLR